MRCWSILSLIFNIAYPKVEGTRCRRTFIAHKLQYLMKLVSFVLSQIIQLQFFDLLYLILFNQSFFFIKYDFLASNDSIRISFMSYSFLSAPAAVTKIVSRGYKKIVYSRKINRKCCQRFVKTAAKFQDNIFKIEKIWATDFKDINIPTKLATSLTRFTICLLIRIIYKINGLHYAQSAHMYKSFEFIY